MKNFFTLIFLGVGLWCLGLLFWSPALAIAAAAPPPVRTATFAMG